MTEHVNVPVDSPFSWVWGARSKVAEGCSNWSKNAKCWEDKTNSSSTDPRLCQESRFFVWAAGRLGDSQSIEKWHPGFIECQNIDPVNEEEELPELWQLCEGRWHGEMILANTPAIPRTSAAPPSANALPGMVFDCLSVATWLQVYFSPMKSASPKQKKYLDTWLWVKK